MVKISTLHTLYWSLSRKDWNSWRPRELRRRGMRNIRSWRGTPRTLGPSTGRSISWTTARTQATLRMSPMMMMKMTALVPPRRKRMMIQQQVRAFAICIWIFAWHIVQWNGPSTVCIKWNDPIPWTTSIIHHVQTFVHFSLCMDGLLVLVEVND